MAVMARLGVWQLDRRQQRIARNADLVAKLEAAPISMNEAALATTWPLPEDRDAVRNIKENMLKTLFSRKYILMTLLVVAAMAVMARLGSCGSLIDASSASCSNADLVAKLEAAPAAMNEAVLAATWPLPEYRAVRNIRAGKRVAIVGSGPAGITVAEDMIKQGHAVTVYEAWPMAGGVLIYGIPNFKVDKHLVQYKIDDLKDAGVRFVTNTRIGEALTVDDLLRDYDAVFLGTGSGVEASMDIPGEKLQGVYQATEFLVRANVPPEMLPPDRRSKPLVGRRVAIIGGGDTAVDCARSSIRLGADEVTIVYRRTEAEMPGNKVERGVSIDEGVAIRYLEAPVEFIGDDAGHVAAMKVIRMRLGEPDKSGRRSPVPVEGSEFVEPIDTVVLAVGYWPDPLMGNTTPNLATRKWGLIVADEETGATTREGVFAAGDNVHGPDLVITAIATAHKASMSIDAYLSGAHIPKPTTNGTARS